MRTEEEIEEMVEALRMHSEFTKNQTVHTMVGLIADGLEWALGKSSDAEKAMNSSLTSYRELVEKLKSATEDSTSGH